MVRVKPPPRTTAFKVVSTHPNQTSHVFDHHPANDVNLRRRRRLHLSLVVSIFPPVLAQSNVIRFLFSLAHGFYDAVELFRKRFDVHLFARFEHSHFARFRAPTLEARPLGRVHASTSRRAHPIARLRVRSRRLNERVRRNVVGAIFGDERLDRRRRLGFRRLSLGRQFVPKLFRLFVALLIFFTLRLRLLRVLLLRFLDVRRRLGSALASSLEFFSKRRRRALILFRRLLRWRRRRRSTATKRDELFRRRRWCAITRISRTTKLSMRR